MNDLFPMIQPEAEAEESTDESYPAYYDVKWDYEKDAPVFKNGNPVIVEGLEAVKAWAWRALHVPRYRYEIYSFDYGSELEALIGQPYTKELKEAEAARYVRECLLINPYIREVKDVETEFSDDRLKISGTLVTVYGEANISV